MKPEIRHLPNAPIDDPPTYDASAQWHDDETITLWANSNMIILDREQARRLRRSITEWLDE